MSDDTCGDTFVKPDVETKDDTKAGNYFVSNYPPFSFWGEEDAPCVESLLNSPEPGDAPLGLYYHVPFCRKRCHFCYFRVYTDKNASEIKDYLDKTITELEYFRKSLSEEAAKKDVKLTLLSFLLKACAAAIRKHPTFNSSLSADKENLVIKHYLNIGVAVDTPDGLVVPVISDVEQKGLIELAKELAEVSTRARTNKLKSSDIEGGCFSISSLGGIGGTAFTPLVNAPEVAVLGVTRSRMVPIWNGKDFNPKLMLPLDLTYDHRVIDGAQAARFMVDLCAILGDMRRMSL